MKQFASILAVVVSAAVAEAARFLPQNPMAPELRARVAAAIDAKCSSPIFGVEEKETRVREVTVDQKKDTYYRSEFSGFYYFDGTHPVGIDITVTSADYAIDNPSVDRFEVLSITTSSPGLCE